MREIDGYGARAVGFVIGPMATTGAKSQGRGANWP
jgi:hypothetical protein